MVQQGENLSEEVKYVRSNMLNPSDKMLPNVLESVSKQKRAKVEAM